MVSHINQLNLPNSCRIPGPSAGARSAHFGQIQLVSNGLINDSNNCCLNSVFLCCHRMGIGQHIVVPTQITCNGVPDYPMLLFQKVMDAFPSSGFSLQQFISSWNQTAGTNGLNRPFLGQYEDIFIFDTLMGALEPHLRQLTPPLLTKYGAKFFCENCHLQYTDIQDGNFRLFQSIPVMTLPVSSRAVSPGQLLTNFLNSPFEAICPNVMCQRRCRGATYEAIKGRFTLLAINRRHYQDFRGNLIPKLMTKLSNTSINTLGDQLCGELVSVICHSGDPNAGHWTSYHKCDDSTWWINDDNNPVIQSHVHPFTGRFSDESVDFVVYKNL